MSSSEYTSSRAGGDELGIEIVLIAMLLAWSAIMAYLLYLYVRQRKLKDELLRLSRLIESGQNRKT